MQQQNCNVLQNRKKKLKTAIIANLILYCRYLQAKHGQEKVHQYLSKIMTFVLNLLTNSY